MDGQLIIGIGLAILAISIPLTVLIVVAMPRRSVNHSEESVVKEQDRVRGLEKVSAGQVEILAGVKVHLGNIDGRLERIEKKLYS